MSNGPRKRRRDRASTAHGDDLRNDPDFRAFERDVHANLVPKIKDSAYVVAFTTGKKPDVKQAVEIGMAILLDKPIVPMIVGAGSVDIPETLRRISTDIIRVPYEPDDPRAQEAIVAELQRVHDAHPELHGEDGETT